jgi:hypothetical protein
MFILLRHVTVGILMINSVINGVLRHAFLVTQNKHFGINTAESYWRKFKFSSFTYTYGSLLALLLGREPPASENCVRVSVITS